MYEPLIKKRKRMKNIITGICIVLGLMAGLAYWYFIGCTSGTCPIQSKWWTSTLYGGLIGYLFSDMILWITNKIKGKNNE